jgi:hypothetical protein
VATTIAQHFVSGQAIDYEDISKEGGDAGHDRGLESEIDADDQRRRPEG